eukprot:Nitzschia sp. Nitz4//scaffold6_size259037//19642//20634//NITZ4_001042-RA/size259037-snap-gene-0.392-mRNA-1//-1//CDS//3329556797//8441//frame0
MTECTADYLPESLSTHNILDYDEEEVSESFRKSDDAIENIEYNPKKPKWWLKKSGNPSRAQKRATNEIFKTHRIPVLSYGDVLDWNAVFSPGSDIWIEIGIGRGENLLALAHRKRDKSVGILGVEIHKAGMATACQRIQQGISENKCWDEYVLYRPELDPYSENTTGCADEMGSAGAKESKPLQQGDSTSPYANVRLYPGDGVKLLPYIPSGSVSAILLTFPDPFPRDFQKKWRVFQTKTLIEIHRVLKKEPGSQGKFFLATDHEGYYDWSHNVMEATNRQCTMYERKGWDEGRRTRLSCWTAVETKSIDE